MGNEANNPVPQGETPGGTVPQGETPTTQTSETLESTTSSDDIQKRLETAEAALKKANAEAAAHRHKAKQFDELNAKLEAEKLSESEKLQKQLADYQKQHSDLTRQLQEARISSAVQLQATRLGFADPGDAARFLDIATLEFDDNGQPTNVEEQLKALLKSKPYLAGKPVTQPTSGGATNPSRSQSDAGSGEITEQYVSDVLSGKVPWQTLTPERRTAILNWQAQNQYSFKKKR